MNKYKIRKNLILNMGGMCNICGFNNYDGLQFDHINDDGFKDKEISTKGYIRRKHRNIYHFNKKFKDNEKLFRQTYQILCANCNQIKETMRREFIRLEEINIPPF